MEDTFPGGVTFISCAELREPDEVLPAIAMARELRVSSGEDEASAVARALGDKPVLLVWGMKDFGFPAKKTIPRIRRTFRDLSLAELPSANLFIQEDAAEDISEAIEKRFG